MKLSKRLIEIMGDIKGCSFFACPGPEGNRIYNMRTCRNCSAIIRLRRIIIELEKKETC